MIIKRLLQRLLSVASVIVLIIDITPGIYSNIRILANYEAGDYTDSSIGQQYRDRVSIDEMDPDGLYRMFHNVAFLNEMMVPHVITLQKDLCYYAEPSDRGEPAYVIPKGTVVKWYNPEDQAGKPLWEAEYGYGTISFPTCDKGWRYVRPFVTAEEAEASDTHYYVRLEILEAVFQQVQQMPEMKQYLESWDTEEGQRYRQTRSIDLFFYDKGIYLSKDLYKTVWHWRDTLLLMVLAIVIIPEFVRRKPDSPESLTGRSRWSE